jgi:hypothetical protein
MCLRADLLHDGLLVEPVDAVAVLVRAWPVELHLLLLRDCLLRYDFCEALEAGCLQPWWLLASVC